jgi:hypothetical protein
MSSGVEAGLKSVWKGEREMKDTQQNRIWQNSLGMWGNVMELKDVKQSWYLRLGCVYQPRFVVA